MSVKRRKLEIDVKNAILHEAGYKCANPVCRTILTLDIHHIVKVAEDGTNSMGNLLALCPNCHALYHRQEIPAQSIRTWKMLLLALNEAYDRQSVNILLALHKIGSLYCTGDAFRDYAPLIAADMVYIVKHGPVQKDYTPLICVHLTDKGKLFVDSWKQGDQDTAVTLKKKEN